MSERESQTSAPLSFMVDRANTVAMLVLSSGILAIYFSLTQNFPAAIIAMLWSVLIDWLDGPAARLTSR